MPNPSHIRLAKRAVSLIKSHGREVILITEHNDGGEDWDPYPEPVEVPIMGVGTGTGGGMNNAEFTESEGVRMVKRKLLIDSKIRPYIDMRVRDKGLELSVKAVTEIAPGEVGVIYKVYITT